MNATLPLLAATDFPALRRRAPDTLQVNLGHKCNQSCLHCRVNASPRHTEMMNADTIALVLPVLPVLRERRMQTLHLTGGATELHPHLCALTADARAAGMPVIDRCCLTILYEPGQEDLASFLAGLSVEVTARGLVTRWPMSTASVVKRCQTALPACRRSTSWATA